MNFKFGPKTLLAALAVFSMTSNNLSWAEGRCKDVIDPTPVTLSAMVEELKVASRSVGPTKATEEFLKKTGTWVQVQDSSGRTRHLRTQVIKSKKKNPVGTYVFIGGLGYSWERFLEAKEFIKAHRDYDIVYLELPGQGATRVLDVFNKIDDAKAEESALLSVRALQQMGPLLGRDSLFQNDKPLTIDMLSYGGWLSPLIFQQILKLLPPGSVQKANLSAPGVEPLLPLFLVEPTDTLTMVVTAVNKIAGDKINEMLDLVNSIRRFVFQPLYYFWGWNVPTYSYATPITKEATNKLKAFLESLSHSATRDEARILANVAMTLGISHLNSAYTWGNLNAKGIDADLVISESDYILPLALHWKLYKSLLKATDSRARLILLEALTPTPEQQEQGIIPGHDIQKDSTPGQQVALAKVQKSQIESDKYFVYITQQGGIHYLSEEEILAKICAQTKGWTQTELSRYQEVFGAALVKTPTFPECK